MTLSHNRSVELTTYTNPCDDRLAYDIDPLKFKYFYERENRLRSEAGADDFFDGFNPKEEGIGEFLQKAYPHSITKSPQISQWYEDVSTWMPPDSENWWLEQFENDEHLDPMPQYWWRQRARNFIVAHEAGNESKPLGAVALTLVYAHERDDRFRALFPKALFYEIRGLVVDESRRGEGIGLKLVKSALYQAIASRRQRVPTLAITTNEAAGKIFQKAQFADQISVDEYPLARKHPDTPDLYNRLACWSRYEETPPNCAACPIKNDTSWWWPTHHYGNIIDRGPVTNPFIHLPQGYVKLGSTYQVD